jgi:prolipoprotein diacylglyceryltransferase
MIPIGSHPAWHSVFELLAYVAGYAIYRRLRPPRPFAMDDTQQWTLLAATSLGALLGCRLLALAEQWTTVLQAWQLGRLPALLVAPGGKTIAGAILGGWAGGALARRITGNRSITGESLAIPLCYGIAIGRIGCLLAGLADDTYGIPARLPWAVDLGDGIGRHPVQIYEMIFLVALAHLLGSKARCLEGARLHVFLASYLCWRIAIDCFKPQPLIHHLGVIQWFCLAGVLLLLVNRAFSGRESHEQATA